MTTELHRAPHKVCDLEEKSIGLLFLYPEIRYFMTEHAASYVVPGGFQPGGFQHGLTSLPVIMDESGLHKAGWGMFRECLLCGKPGGEVGLYLEVGTGIKQANPNVAELRSGQQGPPSLYWSQKPEWGLGPLRSHQHREPGQQASSSGLLLSCPPSFSNPCFPPSLLHLPFPLLSSPLPALLFLCPSSFSDFLSPSLSSYPRLLPPSLSFYNQWRVFRGPSSPTEF